ncbi:DUF481 domain-containing protein [Rheinheimera baltica]|uniref:DUF481 domain-containing protein n=1 Tax=Rheinheimera baltica TaxID=67576 RepID=UPI00273D736F|nr:DUF481 domain-containing protein [Rheinheimera baltica]MDP5151060.1 DUF481 domain-containing protein [Rheinheimera baltica]
MKYYSVLAAAVIASLQVQADDVAGTDKVWTTSAELGAITTSGNTAGTSVTGKIDAKQELQHWSNQYIFSAYFKEDEKTDDNGNKVNERSAEQFMVSAKAAYKLDDEFDKLFTFASYTDDKFGAYTKYTTLAVGYGTRLYNAEDKSLDVEVGPGYFSGERSTGETEKGIIARGAAVFNWTISEAASFAQTLSVEYGEDNTRTLAETSLLAKINGSLQMKAAFRIQSDSEVPMGKKRTDTQTSLTLVYSF